jgi:hypothetical protein
LPTFVLLASYEITVGTRPAAHPVARTGRSLDLATTVTRTQYIGRPPDVGDRQARPGGKI